jgi:hypothetical protein
MIGGMAGGMIPVVGQLPEAGGMLDQSAWLLEAFDILSATETRLAPASG